MPKKPEASREGRRSAAYKVFYGLAVAIIAFVWAYAFKSYFGHYESTHPDVAWAAPWVQVDDMRIDGVLLWNEDVLRAPSSGRVKYPMGRGPVRAPRGAVVASVSSGSSRFAVKAPSEGYFVAGLDGLEGEWRYPKLWPGAGEIPEPPPIKMFEDGAEVKKGAPIGKLVGQPQGLRFIGYAVLTGEMRAILASNDLKVKMDALDTPSRAPVRVYEIMGVAAKIYIDVPWFPMSVLKSRKYCLLAETGEASGVAVPESAIGEKGGRRGVFVLRGAETRFTAVEGRAIGEGRFLATKGLKLGDVVIVNADGASEGRIKLW
jgi:hypothetical protein